MKSRLRLGATADEVAQVQRYVDLSNEALDAGALSPTGRVSTAGQLRRIRALTRDYELIVQRQLHESGHSSGGRADGLIHRFRFAVERQFLPLYFGSPPRWRLALRAAFGRRTLPDFCVIGPVKAGTSDIATTLLLHPSVMTPLAKEIGEFDRLAIYYPTVREKDARRLKYGAALAPYLMPALHRVEYANELARIAPHMKIVITLRNPVWRLYSHWKWEVLAAGKQRLAGLQFMHSFDTYVDKSLELYPSVPMFTAIGWEGLTSSIYWQAVKCWLDLFGAANVLVMESDEYFREKAEFLHQVQDFVGLPRMPLPNLGKTVNENPLRLPPPKQETLDRLQTFFRPHNEKLWDMIGRRFDW